MKGEMKEKALRNRDAFLVWSSAEPNQKEERLLQFFKDNLPSGAPNDLKEKVHSLNINFNKRWRDSSRNKEYFEKKNKSWLDADCTLQPNVANKEDETSNSMGRPLKPFDQCSTKTKKRRVEDIVSSRSAEELEFAAKQSTRTSSQTTGTSKANLSPVDVLALYLDLNLSESKYQLLRSFSVDKMTDQFPSIHVLRQTKKTFLIQNMIVDEISAEVDLQELLNKTARGICETPNISNSCNATLTCKWGFDGSSGHSTYKQKFSSEEMTDEYMFVIALVPLKLTENGTDHVLWENKRPSSTLYCRPIKFMFLKERPELVIREQVAMNENIARLTSYELEIGSHKINVNYTLLLTMVDGSVTNVLSETKSAARCYICKAVPKEINDIEKIVDKIPETDNYRFSLSVLHMRINCFNCLLHISYRLEFKKWSVTKDYKEQYNTAKQRIQSDFKKKMGLCVDKPKQGFGTSNDGNTARRFFENADLSSEITGVDKELIEKFSIMLRVLSSGQPINVSKFEVLVKETRDLYVSKYAWYYMSSSVHKLLIHGCDIVNHFDLPVGTLSEEALEASHKIIRKSRLEHARKSSRENANRDIINALLLGSDPLLSSKRKVVNRKTRKNDTSIDEYLQLCDSEKEEENVILLNNISESDDSDDETDDT